MNKDITIIIDTDGVTIMKRKYSSVEEYKEIQKMYIQLIRAHSTIKSMREFKPFGLMISYFRDYIKGDK